MAKIQKDRSDAEMFAGWKEAAPQGESAWAEDEPSKPVGRTAVHPETNLNQSFVTPALAEKIGKALLELKLELYKDGIVDYDIKVSRESRRVVLTAAPKPAGDRKQEGRK